MVLESAHSGLLGPEDPMTRVKWGGMAAIVAIGVVAVAPQGASYGSAKGAS